MEGCYLDPYLTVLTCLAAVHVTAGVMKMLFTLFNEADKKSAVDERIDVLEMEIMRILSGEYTVQIRPENIMLSPSVMPKKNRQRTEDTENYADDEGEAETDEESGAKED